jgi:preprotein translocase subunit SecA
LGRFGELLGQLTLVTRGPAALRWQRWRAAVERAGALESPLLALTASELRKQSLDLRWRAKEREPLRHLLPEAFALVREAARRVLGMRHYDVQLLAGCTLHDGCIAEMETGEGKTLMATAPAYLNALTGQGVHVVTVNDYLASRDADLMRPVYECLGLTVGCIHNQQPPEDRRQAYACDITYGTANEFAFDFLRDRLNGQSGTVKEQLGSLLFGSQDTEALSIQRGQHYAIVDEADSVLIDEARTPLIICGAAAEEDPEVVAAYLWAAQAAPQIAEDRDYKYDRDTKQVELTPAGRWRVRNLPSPRELHAVAMDEIFEYVERAVKVLRDYQRDRQYVVRDGEVLIVDEFTGRILPGRKWRDGMHQAIEAREGVPVTAATNQAARTTIQNYFLRYEKLSGMTGTAWSARSELRSIYKLRPVRIPTNKPRRRQHLPDQVFATDAQKWQAVAAEVARLHARGQPVLIGTRSIDRSERLSQLLDQQQIPHAVLNAKQHAQEAEIIARAGQRGAVTIATNMAGRGVDIQLEPEVTELGGLSVLGTERHDSARIDRQLEGRCGRQGDPGVAQFWLSLEDELLEAFGPRTLRWLKTLRSGLGGAVEGRLNHLRSLFRRAQSKIERRHYRDRARLMQYEKHRNEMQEKMGLDPYLHSAD